MIHATWALTLATACLLAGDWCNRHLVGWLPDDPPRPGRKQHAGPIPLAGILLAPALLLWLALDQQWLILAACMTVMAIGFLDDRSKERDHDLDWRRKGLALAAGAALGATAIIDPMQAPGAWCLHAVFVFVVTNATNFLDNTNGVAAALAAVGLLQLGGPNWCMAAGCAALAFVPWNWPRPRLFLGDSGAYALGLLLAIASATAAQRSPWPVALAAVALPLVDFVQVLGARLWLGHPPWVGDRRHLTHIVRNLGVPAAAIAPLFTLLAVLTAAAANWWASP